MIAATSKGEPPVSSRVSRAFHDWTDGLDPHQSLISIFDHIRDIPYSLAVPMTDPGTSPEKMLELGRGYCGPKHYLLAELYRRLGYEVVFATFPFLWNDPDIRYPEELRRLAAAQPVAHHLACRVSIDDRWVLVDATWDRPLKRAGFPVNEHWDGRSDTKCAVKPLPAAVRTAFCRTATHAPCRAHGDDKYNPADGEEVHGDEESFARSYREKTIIRTSDEVARIRRFYPEFDAWLEEIRRPP